MKKILLSLTIIAAMVFASSCKDDATPEPTPKAKTKTELLTSSSWKITGGTIVPPIVIFGVEISDMYAMMDECDKDDTKLYKVDKTGVTDEGATKCDPDDPQSETFTWAFDATEKMLIEDGESADIEELTETTLRISTSIDAAVFGGTPGTMHKITITFKH